MNLEHEQLMNDIYQYPETFWELTEENKAIALVEMEETYNKILKAAEASFEQLREIVTALGGYAAMMNKIVNS
jgi:hypothetical protein